MPQRGHPSQEGLWALPSLPMAHGPKPEPEGLLDLSFLTEEEQEAIAGVLQRDARLRQLEEGRISKLRASLEDLGQLKILTGDWFQEARSQRHHNAHFGSDLVRASMRRKKSSRGDQAPGSDGEAKAAVKEKEDVPEPRLSIDEAPQERLRETEGPDLPSPYVPLKASDPEEASQAPEGPGQGELQICAEEADPEPEPASGGEQEPGPPLAQTKAASQILENGEEAPGSDPSLNCMLSSSSSVSSLNSSTLSGSQMSLSGEAEAVQVRGSVHFGLHYEPGAAELRVHVIQCQGLAAARRRRSDPYVKSYLLPDKQSKRKTAVKKRNLNPVFNETLRYSVPQAELQGRVLSLSVWHRESLGRNIFLGEVEVPLDTWDWCSEPTWLPLHPRVPPYPDDLPSRGLLSLSLKYVPAGSEGAGLPPSGELHFWVKEARDLLPLRAGSLDTYVQCFVLPDDSRASRQRTRVVRRSLNPVFNHTMVYDGFGPADLRQACAELSLWDHGALASRQLGGTRLSLGTGALDGFHTRGEAAVAGPPEAAVRVGGWPSTTQNQPGPQDIARSNLSLWTPISGPALG
ncbi:synaptotagmin-like protein 1 isoform X3 [Callithrix jacchus]|uniref:synaptotagmin-like protein 1 isoform X3 n=1 Tax=Callithrix jacchus TaxID=9483 RepID=UPI0004F0B13B|nr:synaptotagmin-like protein 1 isoform X3 [Callithrix jacchus]